MKTLEVRAAGLVPRSIWADDFLGEQELREDAARLLPGKIWRDARVGSFSEMCGPTSAANRAGRRSRQCLGVCCPPGTPVTSACVVCCAQLWTGRSTRVACGGFLQVALWHWCLLVAFGCDIAHVVFGSGHHILCHIWAQPGQLEASQQQRTLY